MKNIERRLQCTYSSREGLSLIYHHLYAERGAIRVAVSPLTCFIALYPIVENGHIPVFIDIDSNTLNMSEEALTQRDDIDAVQVIHLGGNPMRMDKIMEWAKKNNVIVIEDCAQALGALYQGQEVGTFGIYAVASAVKNLYAVAGGLLIGEKLIWSGKQKKVKEWMIVYKYIKRWLEQRTNAQKYNIWNNLYDGLLKLKDTQNNKFGKTIHRLPTRIEEEIRNHLEQLEYINLKRKEKAERLMSMIDMEQYAVQREPKGAISTRNRVFLVAKHREARGVIASLRANGIAANNLTQSYTHPYQEHVRFDKMIGKYYIERLPVYEDIFPHVIAIPCSPGLKDEEIAYIAQKVNCIKSR